MTPAFYVAPSRPSSRGSPGGSSSNPGRRDRQSARSTDKGHAAVSALDTSSSSSPPPSRPSPGRPPRSARVDDSAHENAVNEDDGGGRSTGSNLSGMERNGLSHAAMDESDDAPVSDASMQQQTPSRPQSPLREKQKHDQGQERRDSREQGGGFASGECASGVATGNGNGPRAEDYALQKVQITSFIRHILEQYRFGLQILAEFIQNADDAKATEIDIGLDERVHQGSRVPGRRDDAAAAAELMGPALTVYNNETFSEQDFQNITNTGDSGKRQDASKTGRFCLGINTAFHLGDCILLVTGHRLVAFDPTRKFFTEPLLVEFGRAGDVSFADDYPDFCKAFLAYGITFREEYQGTLFRIPLRTKVEQGGLCKRVYSVQEIWDDLLEDFSENAAACLLFLKKMERIVVHSLTQNGRREVRISGG